ncbi:unknown [Methanothermobacter thermautotrophicus str. Delta H]|uniref:Uncharacterized protein n=1 Tax=Methanothermobacter thermautotrophicus (strain ATCC 29096 / DSM 1053 / JCM 10044 / NBRC 100330 / Delta H) TaxID=187420 RepID=O27176_METTH|nr:hypothetical protein [Methanothermobacter thermautotrophicus]AAB85593.1 unknown [Methanothermobacter thermautotrophicus str. Delta H]WBF05669.1 hypothetical protein ISG35_05240 [Methanothermobacter thermautotrophicus]
MRGWVLFIIVLITITCASAAYSHQPRLVTGSDEVIVQNPEVSQAFYGELKGKPVYFRITSESPFRLYVNILVPYSPDAEPVYVDIIRGDGKVIGTLKGNISTWEPYFEEFGGDYYLKGPEFNGTVDAGTYRLKVYSPANREKFSLAVGSIESFPPDESLKALVLLPVLKSEIFQVPVILLFTQFLGMILGMGSFTVILLLSRLKLGSEDVYRPLVKLGWAGIILTAVAWILTYIKNPLNILGNVENLILILIIILTWRFNAALPDYQRFRGPFTLLMWLLFLLIRVSLIFY